MLQVTFYFLFSIHPSAPERSCRQEVTLKASTEAAVVFTRHVSLRCGSSGETRVVKEKIEDGGPTIDVEGEKKNARGQEVEVSFAAE